MVAAVHVLAPGGRAGDWTALAPPRAPAHDGGRGRAPRPRRDRDALVGLAGDGPGRRGLPARAAERRRDEGGPRRRARPGRQRARAAPPRQGHDQPGDHARARGPRRLARGRQARRRGALVAAVHRRPAGARAQERDLGLGRVRRRQRDDVLSEPVTRAPPGRRRGRAPRARLSLAFLAGAAMDADLPTTRPRARVERCRDLTAADMVRNARTGDVPRRPAHLRGHARRRAGRPRRRSSAWRSRAATCWAEDGAWTVGQREVERAAAARGGLDPDAPAVALDDRLADGRGRCRCRGTSSSLCSRWPKSKTRSAYSGSMPMPLSATVNSQSASPGWPSMAISGGASLRNLTALAIRFWNSWASWMACAGSRAAWRRPRRARRRLEVGRQRPQASSTTSRMSSSAASASSPARTREYSRMPSSRASSGARRRRGGRAARAAPRRACRRRGAPGSARSRRSRASATAGRARRRRRSGRGRRWSGPLAGVARRPRLRRPAVREVLDPREPVELLAVARRARP